MNFYRFSYGPIFISLAILIIVPSLYSAMPDWKYFKDRWGNEYYYDRAGNIHISAEDFAPFLPVHDGAAEYFYNMAVEMIKSHEVENAIYFLKSINAMESENNRVRNIQKKSVAVLSKLRAQHGSRFTRYSMDNCLLLIKNGESFKLINDSLGYTLLMKSCPILIKKRWKYGNRVHSAQFGFSLRKDKTYDYLFGIESKIYRFRLRNVDRAILSWITETGSVGSKRVLLQSGENFKIYSYDYEQSPFSGIEGFFINGRRFFCLRTICHNSLKSRVLGEMKKMISSFRSFN